MPRPPRNYEAEEYPLPHNNYGRFSLGMESSNLKNATILPIFRATNELILPENVEVNPRNAAFSEEIGLSCFQGSIIPRTSFSFTAKMSKLAIETDKVRTMVFYWWPIYTSFSNNISAADEKTGDTVGEILGLLYSDTKNRVSPVYSTTKLTGVNQTFLNTVGVTETFADWGLSVDFGIESIAINLLKIHDALQYYTNKEMLRGSIGRIHRVTLNRDRPYIYSSSNFTNPKVKRINDGTFCGVCYYCPEAVETEWFQTNRAVDVTNIDHMDISYRIKFDEWNPNFDQSV